jgi:hypothetical protein
MIYPDTPLETWLKKHPISVVEGLCICGNKVSTTIPILTSKKIGLVSPKCKCGRRESVSTYVSRSVEDRNKDLELFF